ncbi:CPBP family intramembrane metalloprotease [Nesterenkonia sp. CL21]|uniref:CPBP family intramembrane glutamic endopeptidase n=1 Tax=Nesterenkonia sp. CL21 TaxID=3064894 RepID=UPI00287A6B62|nr:lysostaphin resistance A-like protein [Nesterenkonia sp. CL21]MDS2172804.1 CPBP family intramembrane metalloprotease [Nesterenkonia sp. CL21]
MSTPPQEPERHGPPPHPPGPPPYPQAPHLYGHPPAGQPQGPGPYAPSGPGAAPWGNPYAQGQHPAPQHSTHHPSPFPPQPPAQTLPDPKDRYSRGIWRQPDSRPGRFLWWDLLPTVPYLVIILGANLVTMMFFPGGDEVTLTSAESRQEFLINGLIFGSLTVLILAVAGKALWRSLVVFTHHALAWLKIFLIPAMWLSIVVLNVMLMALIMTVTGQEPETSANQAGIEAMLQAVPFWAALLVLGLLGPLVEEYIFRHLLIGKLSRHLNIWLCAVISVLPFALIHVSSEIISGDLMGVLTTVVPYLTMSIIFTLAYIFSGRSLLFVWLVHAFNNCMAVTLQYWLSPLLEDIDGLEPTGVIPALLQAAAVPLGGA